MFQRWVAADVEENEVTCIGEKTPEHVLSLELLDQLVPRHADRARGPRRPGRSGQCAWDFNMGISRAANFPRRYPSFADFAETFARNWSRSVGVGAHGSGGSTARRYYQIQGRGRGRRAIAPIVRRLFRFCERRRPRRLDVQAGIQPRAPGRTVGYRPRCVATPL